MPQSKLFGFPPSIDNNCELLILGSMPSVASLSANEYYAHPQNRFWPLMSYLLQGKSEPPKAYDERLSMLLRHHIALWDAIGTCEREGSLDSAIKKESGNNIASLLNRYEKIHTIICNGAKSFATFKKYNKILLSKSGLSIHALPSTSPANARWRMADLQNVWGKAISDALK